ncbi:MAG: hypothetical protein KF768_03280 [Phycisphaeraceae bacterium]|nr:hypothetical protein [Phycisphaeraceae bacterium]
MQLFLIRAARTNTQDPTVLTPRGREQAEYLGRWLTDRRGSAEAMARAAASGSGPGSVWTSGDASAMETARVVAKALGIESCVRPELNAGADVRGFVRLLQSHADRSLARSSPGCAALLVCSPIAVAELVSALLSPEQASAVLLRAGEALELEVRMAQPIGTSRLVARGYLDERSAPRSEVDRLADAVRARAAA